MWHVRYCDGDHTRCARFKRIASGDTVPPMMLPNGQMLRFSMHGGE